MKQLLLFICCFLFIQAGISLAQSPVVEWQKSLGGPNGDYPHMIRLTSDGGYIVAGSVQSEGGDIMGYHGNILVGDIWVVKLSNTGTIQWQRCLGGFSVETGADIRQTSDGGYIVLGSSGTVDCNLTGNHGGLDYWLVKLNAVGDVVWQKMYGGSQNEYAYSLDVTSDGGYILAGLTESQNGDVTVNHGYRDYWVVKTDGNGNMQWQKSLGGSGDDACYGVRATTDGGYIVAGYTESNDGDVTGNHGNRDYWIVKINSSGALQWQKCFGGSRSDEASSIQVTPDGGYIVAGYAGSNDGDVSGNHIALAVGFTDYWVVKLNATGNIQWQKCYGGKLNDKAFYIQNTNDGGYVVNGFAESADGDATCMAGVDDMWIIKVDNAGNLQWQKELGGDLYDEGFCVQPLSDGSFIAAGGSCSSNVAGHHQATNLGTCDDYWIVKLSAPVATPPNPTVTILPAPANICAGNSVTFTASAMNAGINPVYQWTRDGVPVGNNSATYAASNFTAGTVLTCTVTSGGPCDNSNLQGSASVTININNNILSPDVKIIASNTVICACTPVIFEAAVANGGLAPLYQWKVNGANTGVNGNFFTTNTLKAGDVITCTYSDYSGCIVNGSVVSNAITMTTGTAQPPTVSISTPATIICQGSTVTFAAAASDAGINPSYQWKVNGSNAGTNNKNFTTSTLNNGDVVTCTVTPDPAASCTQAGLVTSNPVTITVTGKVNPSVNVNVPSTTVCTGSAVTFTAVPANAGSNPSYQWIVNGTNVGTNSNTFSSAALADGDQVSCMITVDPLYTCAGSITAASGVVTMSVINQAAPTVNITSPATELCEGQLMIFNAAPGNAGTSPGYQWVINNVPINEHSPTFSTGLLSNGDQVSCIITPGAGACTTSPVSSNTLVAAINPLPAITIFPADTFVTKGNYVQLKAIITGNILFYNWDPAGKLTNSVTLTPITVPLTDNTIFTLSVTSDKGCTAVSTANIKVGRPLLMPNAFTPNGDGKNDVFRIPAGVSLQLTEFTIFDRWGYRVFVTNDLSKGWDGTFNGRRLDTGVYVYIVNGSNENGKVLLKGTVVLVR